ncbi:4911_t:CDS:10 [Rhizophagus irregularis]|nr:4911_t:CDS:10 [Rhizophagus irregularis]
MEESQTTNKELIHISDDQEKISSKPKQEILDEDSYTEALSEIIKRDFFPSLLTLEAQNDYVDAWNTNNPELIKEATRKLTELTTPTLKTPVQTPSTVIGIHGEWDTPISTSSRSGEFKKPLPKKYNINMSLDSFQSKYTSEDNASYPCNILLFASFLFYIILKLMKKASEQQREKHKWMYEKEDQEDNKGEIKLIEGPDQPRIAGIASWKYKVRNSLMFYPEGHDKGTVEENTRCAPKKIVHSATRFESAEEATIANHAAATAAAAAASGIDLDSSSNASETPTVGGYSFVTATPSPNPSQIDSSELMTWGMIEGTPLLIGGETPGAEWNNVIAFSRFMLNIKFYFDYNVLGRSFQLPPTQRREIIGMNLSNNASRNIRKRNLSMKSPNPYVTQSPTSKIASPRERASYLSPAARKLLRKSNLPKSVGVDVQLRASYAASPRNRALVTPSKLVTPTFNSFPDKYDVTPKVKTEEPSIKDK